MGCLFPDAFKIDVADEASVREPVDPDVYDDGACFYHLRQDEIWLPHRHDQNIGKDRKLCEISRFCVTNADGRVALHQHQRHRLSDDIAGANDHDIAPLERDAFMLKQTDDAIRRAGREYGIPDHKPADIVEMEAIDVFVDINGSQDLIDAKLRWHRQLNEDAVNVGVPVQVLDFRDHGFRIGVGRKIDHCRAYADVFASPDFISHVNGGCGVIANHDHRKAGYQARLRFQADDPLLAFSTDALCDSRSIDDFG